MTNKKNDEMAGFSFPGGNEFESYRYLGFHITDDDRGEKYAVFRVYAPNAKKVFLVGDFNGWDESLPMERTDNGVFEIFLEANRLGTGQNYKFKIITAGDMVLYKADPYAVFAETPPATASKISLAPPYEWHDAGYIKNRKDLFFQKGKNIPLNIYKLSANLWKGNLSYSALADELIPYVKQLGYTHIELTPIMEHLSDDISDPKITGFYAPTSRHGTPRDFKGFVDALHGAGLGVILDLDFANIPKCEHGLYRFDGSPLFERKNGEGDKGLSFDLSDSFVKSFLLSTAIYWIEEFHIDGISTDISFLLYENREEDVFPLFRALNRKILCNHPDIITIAKAPTGTCGITDSPEEGGLGFCFARDRRLERELLSLSDLAFDAKLCPSVKCALTSLSDCESFLSGLRYDGEKLFAASKLLIFCMMFSDSKKLTFAGSEIGQTDSKDTKGKVCWSCLSDSLRKKHQLFVRDINKLYLSTPVLWQQGCVVQNDKSSDDLSCITILSRINCKDVAYKELIAVVNFGNDALSQAKIKTYRKTSYRKLISSALSVYGGTEEKDSADFESAIDRDGSFYITADISPMSAYLFESQDET